MKNDFYEFCKNFNEVDNALQMRNMLRWNGRDIKNKENLSEHTHLVISCAIQIFDALPNIIKAKVNFEKLIRVCLIHDSFEMLRGDILSITKDVVPGLRTYITDEENEFIKSRVKDVDEITLEICELADLMACYKFIEFELRYPSNDFAKNVYISCLNKYKSKTLDFYKKYNLNVLDNCENEVSEIKLSKGYKLDAGVDIILNEPVMFMPHSTTSKTLDINICPDVGIAGILCSRTSAAIKGLIVAMCPIDPGYTGKITAIVTNVSNDIITYNKGESFCQVMFIPFSDNSIETEIRMNIDRGNRRLGSSL